MNEKRRRRLRKLISDEIRERESLIRNEENRRSKIIEAYLLLPGKSDDIADRAVLSDLLSTNVLAETSKLRQEIEELSRIQRESRLDIDGESWR